MATLVIVHGSWGGGWEWAPIARGLRERGHEVFTPTLTGLGERAHLGGAEVGLGVHIEDVYALLAFEELSDVILCGHSYAGMVVTGVADRAPDRIRRLVYLDAFVPRHDQALHDLLPTEVAQALVESARAGRIPIPVELLPPEGALPEEVRARYIARLRPHPVASQVEPLQLSGAVESLPRGFVRCTGEDPDGDMTAPFAERARAEGWLYRELPTAHDLHVLDPEGTTAILDELARA